ncbi:MAG: hypothetical protein L6Q47_06710 [Ignavibacteriaceae bacterium]|nr:hypothetical protein [Ignavibacteriaceae bacterium]
MKAVFSVIFILLQAAMLFPQAVSGADSLGDKKLFQIKRYNYVLDYIAEKKFEEITKDIIKADGKSVIPGYNPEEDVYILFSGVKDMNEFQLIRRDDKGLTDRIVEAKNVYLIWIDDELNDDYEINYEIHERETALQKDFASVKSWFTGLKTDANTTRGDDAVYNYYYKIIKLEGVICPSDIRISLKVLNQGKVKAEKDASYINHEISYYNVALGVSASPGKEKNFLIKDKQLFLSNNVRNEWNGQFILGFNFHFGREMDSWNPSYIPWEGEFWSDFHKRLNLFVGLDISSKPFDNLYAGLGLNITKDIQLVSGLVWYRSTQVSNGEDVGDVNSLDDIKNFFPKKYEPKIYVGLSFSTFAVSKMLGLTK